MEPQEIAQQLRKPEGENGRIVGQKMNESNLTMNRWAMEALAISAKERVLEIGFGNGRFIPDILAMAPEVHYTGLDMSETMLEEAAHWNAEFIRLGTVHLQLGTSNALPFPNHSFDKVLTVNTLYFWESPEQDLREIRRVLRPTGRLSLGFRTEQFMKTLPFTQYGFRMYGVEEVIELLQRNGFAIVRVIQREEQGVSVMGGDITKDTVVVCAEPISLPH